MANLAGGGGGGGGKSTYTPGAISSPVNMYFKSISNMQVCYPTNHEAMGHRHCEPKYRI